MIASHGTHSSHIETLSSTALLAYLRIAFGSSAAADDSPCMHSFSA